ncbi:MAG: aldolase [Pseudomonadota bacterium]
MSGPPEILTEATGVAVAVDADGPLAGLILRGASGAGKSTIAAQLIVACPHRRTRLVGDDVVAVVRGPEGLDLAAPPDAPAGVRGRLEVRGFGPAPAAFAPRARLRLVADLRADAPRLPERAAFTHDGATAALLPLRADDPTAAAARIRLILRAIIAGQ